MKYKHSKDIHNATEVPRFKLLYSTDINLAYKWAQHFHILTLNFITHCHLVSNSS